MEQVNEFNAYRYSDNYTIQTESEPVNVFGCEHNATEAKALARYISSSKGIKVVVVTNPRHLVADAKKFRPQPLRYEFRQEAFETMGVWPRAK